MGESDASVEISEGRMLPIGANWYGFLNSGDSGRIAASQDQLVELISTNSLQNQSFLDAVRVRVFRFWLLQTSVLW